MEIFNKMKFFTFYFLLFAVVFNVGFVMADQADADFAQASAYVVLQFVDAGQTVTGERWVDLSLYHDDLESDLEYIYSSESGMDPTDYNDAVADLASAEIYLDLAADYYDDADLEKLSGDSDYSSGENAYGISYWFGAENSFGQAEIHYNTVLSYLDLSEQDLDDAEIYLDGVNDILDLYR